MKKSIFIFFIFTLVSCTTIKDSSYKEILDNSLHDIEVDSVKFFTGGLPFIRPIIAGSTDTLFTDSIQIKKSIRKLIRQKYGLYEQNLGCVIDKQNIILGKKYRKITSQYLNKRNGEGWQEKMKKELNEIDK